MTRQEQIEKMIATLDAGMTHYLNGTDCYKKAVNYLRTLPAEQPHGKSITWIACKDRMPKQATQYLCYQEDSPSLVYLATTWSKAEGFYLDMGLGKSHQIRVHPTHWAEINIPDCQPKAEPEQSEEPFYDCPVVCDPSIQQLPCADCPYIKPKPAKSEPTEAEEFTIDKAVKGILTHGCADYIASACNVIACCDKKQRARIEALEKQNAQLEAERDEAIGAANVLQQTVTIQIAELAKARECHNTLLDSAVQVEEQLVAAIRVNDELAEENAVLAKGMKGWQDKALKYLAALKLFGQHLSSCRRLAYPGGSEKSRRCTCGFEKAKEK